MTNNIEKLYELAKVEKIKTCYWNCKHLFPCKECCIYKDETVDFVFPPFTDTKLLELESYIFQLNYGYCHLERYLDANFENNKVKNLFFVWMYRIGDIGYYDEETNQSYDDFDIEYHNTDRKQALAGLVCELWEDLTDTQMEEVRGILQ